ncbi:hypothetical protein ALI144C_07765 [Actinosynnema sp. ALI-1.44]|uniref:hypothetical protein n=1 Tax=Actinosynnema sp. ALI-1.44 TaxID=1933779 RepID=UPI00097C75EB|nr:hypothetical protein [Actinosynnema sp. ALI-1.44]ONI87832.1 hypothetical protein ALI144C_07765 [Actinosynnema sp. ALI-1.44]
MTDARRTRKTSDTQGSADRPSGAFRPLLWLALLISASGNVVVSSANLNALINVAFGLTTVSCAATLIVHHYRHHRR